MACTDGEDVAYYYFRAGPQIDEEMRCLFVVLVRKKNDPSLQQTAKSFVPPPNTRDGRNLGQRKARFCRNYGTAIEYSSSIYYFEV